MVQKEIIDKIKSCIFYLTNNGYVINKAFLYGSFARNEAYEDSDIDLMLVSDTFDNSSIEDKANVWVLTSDIDSRIEPYMVGTKRFLTDNYSPLLEIVRQEGIEIEI